MSGIKEEHTGNERLWWNVADLETLKFALKDKYQSFLCIFDKNQAIGKRFGASSLPYVLEKNKSK